MPNAFTSETPVTDSKLNQGNHCSMNHRSKLKSLACGIALSLVASAALHAQTATTSAPMPPPPPRHGPSPGGPGGPGHDPLQMLTGVLELTDAQKAQVQPVLDQA